jgi:FAD dependent oxidoreductase
MNPVRTLALAGAISAALSPSLWAHGEPIVQQCEVLVIGDSAAGLAAAVAASELGAQTCLLAETPWIGGQLLTVPAWDEPPGHPNGPSCDLTWPASRPFAASYRAMRESIQDQANSGYFFACGATTTNCPLPNSPLHYRDRFNPGNNTTSGFAFEPYTLVTHINSLLANPLISVHRNAVVTAKRVSPDGTRVTGANATIVGMPYQFLATMTIDATEFGDFLAMAPVIPYRLGVDALADTGEPHAGPAANPNCVNPITYTFFLQRPPGGGAAIAQPAGYDASTYSLDPGNPVVYNPSEAACSRPAATFWNWRRMHWPPQFISPNTESTQINSPSQRFGNPAPPKPNKGGNDYNRKCYLAPGTTDPDAGCEVVEGGTRSAELNQAKDLAKGFAYWIQTTLKPAGAGFTEWPMAGYVTAGTFGAAYNDGFAPIPYVRESRRIKAIKTVVEGDISRALYTAEVGGTIPPPRARKFADSVGIGHYNIDLHDCAPGEPFLNPPATPRDSLPYQIPLGSMIPLLASGVPAEGFLASSKNIGTTHLTNGAYRLHPSEWHIGLASGAAAAVAIQENTTPRFMATGHEPQFGQASRPHVRALRVLQQKLVRDLGSPLYWWNDVWEAYPEDPTPVQQAKKTLFEATQMVAADDIMTGAPGTGLRFDPGTQITRGIGALIIMRAVHTLTPVDTTCIGTAFVDVPCPGSGVPTPWGGHYPVVQALKNANALVTTQSDSCAAGAITSTHFRPDCPLKRRDWTRFLVRALGLELTVSATPTFTDVPATDPDYVYIETARWANLTDVTSGAYRPNDILTRAEAAIMAYDAIRRYYTLE